MRVAIEAHTAVASERALPVTRGRAPRRRARYIERTELHLRRRYILDIASMAASLPGSIVEMPEEEVGSLMLSSQHLDLQVQMARDFNERHRVDAATVIDDTNAELCPRFKQVVLLGRAFQSRAATPVLALVCFGGSFSLALQPFGPMRDDPRATEEVMEMYAVQTAMVTLGICLLALALVSAREAVIPGGALDSLGQGKVKISSQARKRLQLWSYALSFFASCSVLAGLAMTVWVFLPDTELSVSALTPFAQQVTFYSAFPHLMMCTFDVLIIPAGLGVLLSLHGAATLATDAVAEVIRKAEALDFKNMEQWAALEAGCVNLAEVIMPCVSRGWGMTVLFGFAFGWVGALLFFLTSFPAQGMAKLGQLFLCVFTALVPLAVAWPLAAVSSDCSKLLNLLNKMRLRDLSQHARLRALETAMRQLNNNRGLGFMVK